MFKRVLLYWRRNLDAQFLAKVANFCSRAEADLSLVAVIPPPPRSLQDIWGVRSKEVDETLASDIRTSAANLLEQVGVDPSKVDCVVRRGKPFVEVVRHVQQWKADLLTLPSVGGPNLDSETLHLIRKCPCPVWVANPTLWTGHVKILATVQASEDDGSRELDIRTLAYAKNLVDLLDGRLYVLHCWRSYIESMSTSKFIFGGEDVEVYLEKEEDAARDIFQRILDESNLNKEVKSIFSKGNPADIIPEFAASRAMDIVVMGSLARRGIPGLLIGNTAEQLVEKLPCSLFTIKQKDFISPIV